MAKYVCVCVCACVRACLHACVQVVLGVGGTHIMWVYALDKHADTRCNLVNTCILGMMPGKRRRGYPTMQYIDNIKKWTRAPLKKTVGEDRTAWRERSCAAGAANVRTDAAPPPTKVK